MNIKKRGCKVQQRLKCYQDDNQTLLQTKCDRNKRNALLVRIGEKKILEETIDKLKKEVESQKRSIEGEQDNKDHINKKKKKN